jgi:hypothetical protein
VVLNINGSLGILLVDTPTQTLGSTHPSTISKLFVLLLLSAGLLNSTGMKMYEMSHGKFSFHAYQVL